jgi:transposase
VQALLGPLQRVIAALDAELTALTRQVEAAAPADLPVGMGKLTSQILEREICDWARFENRRQVGSYTGMCPREDTSSDRRFQGPINKHGNPRVRATLIELSWRLLQVQPGYRAVAKWLPVLAHPKTTQAKRQQIVVAIGRQFSVDWWRVRTGRCAASAVGLKLKPGTPPAPAASTPPP